MIRKFAGNPKNPDYRKLAGWGWDIYGAHQFNVLTSLGLRSEHNLLDIGCGGLRGGRLFIAYLEKGNYYGIEPASWAIKEAIENEFGQEYINIRKPSFDYNLEANLDVFNKKFDFILAHSVLIHAPTVWIENCFKKIKKVLKPNGKFVANIIFDKVDSKESTWEYPLTRQHSKKTISNLVSQAGLKMEITNIKHPALEILKQNHTWIILSIDHK